MYISLYIYEQMGIMSSKFCCELIIYLYIYRYVYIVFLAEHICLSGLFIVYTSGLMSYSCAGRKSIIYL